MNRTFKSPGSLFNICMNFLIQTKPSDIILLGKLPMELYQEYKKRSLNELYNRFLYPNIVIIRMLMFHRR